MTIETLTLEEQSELIDARHHIGLHWTVIGSLIADISDELTDEKLNVLEAQDLLQSLAVTRERKIELSRLLVSLPNLSLPLRWKLVIKEYVNPRTLDNTLKSFNANVKTLSNTVVSEMSSDDVAAWNMITSEMTLASLPVLVLHNKNMHLLMKLINENYSDVDKVTGFFKTYVLEPYGLNDRNKINPITVVKDRFTIIEAYTSKLNAAQKATILNIEDAILNQPEIIEAKIVFLDEIVTLFSDIPPAQVNPNAIQHLIIPFNTYKLQEQIISLYQAGSFMIMESVTEINGESYSLYYSIGMMRRYGLELLVSGLDIETASGVLNGVFTELKGSKKKPSQNKMMNAIVTTLAKLYPQCNGEVLRMPYKDAVADYADTMRLGVSNEDVTDKKFVYQIVIHDPANGFNNKVLDGFKTFPGGLSK